MDQRIVKVLLWNATAHRWLPVDLIAGGELTPAQLAEISPKNVSALGLGQVASLDPILVAALTTTQAKALRTEQVSFFTTTQIPSLSVENLGVLTTSQVQGFTTSQLAVMTPEQLTVLNPGDPYAGGGTQGPSSNGDGSTKIPV
jgi:hypothetical protein